MNKEHYTISRTTLKIVLKALENNWFTATEEDEFNNDDIIEAEMLLKKEIEKQETNKSPPPT
jgi:hypothetical protein